MITGSVDGEWQAWVRLGIRSRAGQEQELTAVLDTGFTGALTLPPARIAALGLPWRTRGSAILANGAEDRFDIYAAVVIWDGRPRHILIEAADTEPLVGMGLLNGYEILLQAVPGGLVQIQPLGRT